MDFSIPDYIFSKYINQQSDDCDSFISREQERSGGEMRENVKCSMCGKDEFLFNGHDYKMFLQHSCCFECYLKYLE